MILAIFLLGGAAALALMALVCGLCHADTAPPIRTVKARGELVDIHA